MSNFVACPQYFGFENPFGNRRLICEAAKPLNFSPDHLKTRSGASG